MVQLIMIADDLTGALDSAVELKKKGLRVYVSLNENLTYKEILDNFDVVVVNSESRHEPPEKAYIKVKKIVTKALEVGIKKFYKKTDSVLRGNIGAEFKAVLDVTGGKEMFFIPGHPKMGRTTVQGIQYYKGEKLEDSFLGNDPFDPLKTSKVKDIISSQSNSKIIEIGIGESIPKSTYEVTVYVFDSKNEEDIRKHVETIKEKKNTEDCLLLAGCAGMAAFISTFLNYEMGKNATPMLVPLHEHVLIVSGSINKIAKAQIEELRKRDVICIEIEGEQAEIKEATDYATHLFANSKVLVLETKSNDNNISCTALCKSDLELKRMNFSKNLAKITEKIMKNSSDCDLIVVGGDTLVSILSKLLVESICLIDLLDECLVVSQIEMKNGHKFRLISKSGGLGNEKSLIRACEALKVM